MLNLTALKKFFALLKIKQQPHEDFLTANLQRKVDWIKKYSTYNLNDRQKQAIENDKVLILAIEGYVGIQHEIITHLFTRLEDATREIEMLRTDAAGFFQDKLTAEQALRDYIKQHHEGEIQPAA